MAKDKNKQKHKNDKLNKDNILEKEIIDIKELTDEEKTLILNKIKSIKKVKYLQIIPNLLSLITITGLINWVNYDKGYLLILLVFIIAIVDYLLSILVNKYLYRLVFLTLYSIKLLPSIIGFIIGYFIKGITYGKFIIITSVFVLYNKFKTILNSLLQNLINLKKEVNNNGNL